MSAEPEVSQVKRLQQFITYARLAASTVMIVGIGVLAGWLLDVPVLRAVLPGWTAMMVNTACMFTILGAGLWCATFRTSQAGSLIRRLGSVLVIIVGGLTLVEYVLSVNLAIDLLLPFELQHSQPVPFPGRMAPATALCFLLSGLGLLFDGRPLLPQFFASSALFISLMALVGYLFSVSALYSVGLYSSMAVHTVIALVLFNTGLLVIQERSEFVELLTSNTAGGKVARSLLASIPVVILGIGGALLAGEKQGYYDNRLSLAWMATLSIATLVAVILRTARHLHQIDKSRGSAQAELAALNAALELRVAERTSALETANRSLMSEMSRRQKVEDDVRRLSLTDELTGLHNRRSFFLLADQLMHSARRNDQSCLLFFIDLDGLKKLNDVHGHEAGDLAIIAAAQVLKTAFRVSDVVARIGGDEFVVLAADVKESADTLSARVQALVDEFNGSDLCRYPIGLSIGAVRCLPKELKPLGELLATADAAMYADKQRRQQTLYRDGCALRVPPTHGGGLLESPSVT
ncbi:GGDEF domain-containing protein [Pseudomonas sp. RTB3]|uniref:GGDEF domain-containing protein n=1 Tax=unclassified Pseudomonas TaxID=196821 RepID=UPI002B22C8EA|nr:MULTISPECIES: GGDEF domain-containing protein [unclassified Pseudomonas]MEB0009729.1 GGDEF domain-containing protein [Pseudomonas sp. RTB2]MEB0015964.1 GGDEF domain-containing protein [Pseudomonas sp. RTB3]MEB0271794.1 GGDEF domain-containing protein [Pseudomonas sp. 5B4]